jgi:hypothetical protein
MQSPDRTPLPPSTEGQTVTVLLPTLQHGRRKKNRQQNLGNNKSKKKAEDQIILSVGERKKEASWLGRRDNVSYLMPGETARRNQLTSLLP